MTSDEVVLSVIIPCLNVAAVLPEQLEALAAQDATFPWEALIVDNGSSDATIAVAESFAGRVPGLRVVQEARRGRHHACNRGAAEAASPLLAFVDGDDRAYSTFVRVMAAALTAAPMVGGRLDHDFDRQGAPPTFGTVQTKELMAGYDFLPHASGASMGVRRSVFEELGGFANEAPFCEDIDLSWRAQLAGYAIRFEPEAAVYYRQRSDLRAMYRQHRNFGEARAFLYRRYARLGMPRRGPRAVAAEWYAIAKAIPFLGSADVRARWVRRAGRVVGATRGSVRYGVLCL